MPSPQSGASAALACLLASVLLSCFLILLPNQLPRLNLLAATGTWHLSVPCLSSGRINSGTSGTVGISANIFGAAHLFIVTWYLGVRTYAPSLRARSSIWFLDSAAFVSREATSLRVRISIGQWLPWQPIHVRS